MHVEAVFLPRHDWVPNNPRLPVLMYRNAFSGSSDYAADFERRVSAHGWTGLWRNGIFDYRHYHTGAHEVLGIAAGTAEVEIGGPGALELKVRAGDCLILPAGTGHCRLWKDNAFLVIGAYPPGQQADMKTAAPSADDLERIAALPLPSSDPLEGATGALMQHWLPPG